MKKAFLKAFEREVHVSHWGNVSAQKQVEMMSDGSSTTRIRAKPRTGEDMRSLTSSMSIPTIFRIHGNLAEDSYNVQDMI